MTPYHIPALLQETIQLLDPKRGGIYVDATLGGGGHTRALLDAEPSCRVVSFDQDADALANAASWASSYSERLMLVRGNFRYLTNFLRYLGIDAVDGVLADLGVSFHHFDTAGRGFSFRFDDAPLDMRMNADAARTAADIANDMPVEDLARILSLYGEVNNAPRTARAIAAARPLATAADLAAAVAPTLNPKREKQDLSKVFQALRIEVNDEMGALNTFLAQALKALKPGGRLAVLTYHSLEDRLVKNFMKTGNVVGDSATDFYGRSLSPWTLVTRKPITASSEEVATNPRARSAKLRCAQKNATEE